MELVIRIHVQWQIVVLWYVTPCILVYKHVVQECTNCKKEMWWNTVMRGPYMNPNLQI